MWLHSREPEKLVYSVPQQIALKTRKISEITAMASNKEIMADKSKHLESTPGKVFRPRHPAKKSPAKMFEGEHCALSIPLPNSLLAWEGNQIAFCIVQTATIIRNRKQKQDPATRYQYITYISLRKAIKQTMVEWKDFAKTWHEEPRGI